MNFNNWKSAHIQYRIIYKPTGKVKHRTKTFEEAEAYLAKQKEKENFEIKVIARKIVKKKKESCEHLHDRVFLCKNCYAEHIADEMERLRRRGNPIFHCSVICWSWKDCAFFEPPQRPPLPHTSTPMSSVNAGEPERYQEPNCAHIAGVDDVIYCKRKHPGAVVLQLENAMVLERRTREIPLFQSQMVDNMKKTMFSPETQESFLSAFPPEMREMKKRELQATMRLVENSLAGQVKQLEEEGMDFFLVKAGDMKLQVEVCENKILVQEPKKKVVAEGDGDAGTTGDGRGTQGTV